AMFTRRPAQGESFAAALALHGLAVDVLPVSRIPWTLDGWLAYDVAIFHNVPAIDVHTGQQELMEAFVRDHGGGLIVLGGESSFGPGGYFGTSFERVLPLSSLVPQESPSVAMLFVLDKSGSMQQRVGAVTRLDIAKEATELAIEL